MLRSGVITVAAQLQLLTTYWMITYHTDTIHFASPFCQLTALNTTSTEHRE